MILFPLLALALLVSACTPEIVPGITAAPTRGVTLIPYISPTPVMLQTPTPTVRSSPTPLPTATPTPFMYAIAAGDTLLGIAFKFGLTLEALLAANPGIDPQFLRIGDPLIIPLGDNPVVAAQPTPAAFAAPVGAPACISQADGSSWCYWLIRNEGGEPLENLAAQMTVYDNEGQPLATRTALTPVNVLPPGAQLPLMAWFPPQAEEIVSVNAVLASALAVPAGDARYLGVTLNFETALRLGYAHISGTVEINGKTPASQIWFALVAYGAGDHFLGARRITLEGPFDQGVPLSFEGEVFSLGGEIVRVEVFAEAFP